MRPWGMAGAAAGLGLAFALALRLPFLGDTAITIVSDLGQLVAAFVASVACAVAANRAHGRHRRSWLWISVGTGFWVAGEAVWTWYEVVLDQEVPFPSLADVGFLLLPVSMAIGLVTRLGSQSEQMAARGRDILDGTVIATSLLAISWVTTLGSVVRARPGAWAPLMLLLAYPVLDLVVATLVLLALARGASHERRTLVVLGVGMGGLALADSAYVYLVQIGSYSSADLVSSGWVLPFLLIAAAALGAAPGSAGMSGTGHAVASPAELWEASPLRLALPYLPLVTAGVVLVVSVLRAPSTAVADVLFGVALVLLVLTRQFLALLDNRRLLEALSIARDQLRHQATHDGLTGLANRSLFAARLDRALERSDADVSVLFCDLDDFKLVNDRYGHNIGDEMLVLVGQRLLQCVRESDTVARLGGDEFAILVQSAHAATVAERVVDLLSRPMELHGRMLSTSASVGVAHHHLLRPTPPPPLPGHLSQSAADDRRARRPVLTSSGAGEPEHQALANLMLREADMAMYAAKRAGKARAVLADVSPLLDSSTERPRAEEAPSGISR